MYVIEDLTTFESMEAAESIQKTIWDSTIRLPLAARFLYAPDASYANAIVYVFNRSVGEGVITTAAADGSVESGPFPAAVNDQVVVSFELAEQLSSRCVIIGEAPLLECDL